ncbi:hypothetical protein AAVH_15835 [Aphelenchoides avenae]|nr:hypothetical protein AAVH_15835 [Aphelenchus avenae]
MDSESWSESKLQNHEAEAGGQDQHSTSERCDVRKQKQEPNFGAEPKGQGTRVLGHDQGLDQGQQTYDAGVWHQ